VAADETKSPAAEASHRRKCKERLKALPIAGGTSTAENPIDALLFSCSQANNQRVLQKFADHGFEKIDRTVELFIKYRLEKLKWKI
jgi:hypothetical protein